MRGPGTLSRSRVLLALAAAAAGAALVATARAQDGRPAAAAKKPDVDTMDVELLRENLLKIWIVEESSERYNQMRIAQKSFDLLTPLQPTGDPALDAENREARRKLDFQLRSYLEMELDGAIEVSDILTRVLGKSAAADPSKTKDAALREILDRTLPAIDWRNVDLSAALEDLGRKASVPVQFVGVPKNTDLKVTLQFDAGFTVQMVIEYIQGIHRVEWKYENGGLRFEFVPDGLPR